MSKMYTSLVGRSCGADIPTPGGSGETEGQDNCTIVAVFLKRHKFRLVVADKDGLLWERGIDDVSLTESE